MLATDFIFEIKIKLILIFIFDGMTSNITNIINNASKLKTVYWNGAI